MKQSKFYTEGDIVWAKVKNYPWWPSMIAQINIDVDGTTKYVENFSEYSKTKDPALKTAINLANQGKLAEFIQQPEEDKKKPVKNTKEKGTKKEEVWTLKRTGEADEDEEYCTIYLPLLVPKRLSNVLTV